jgi:hypothetical protein
MGVSEHPASGAANVRYCAKADVAGWRWPCRYDGGIGDIRSVAL